MGLYDAHHHENNFHDPRAAGPARHSYNLGPQHNLPVYCLVVPRHCFDVWPLFVTRCFGAEHLVAKFYYLGQPVVPRTHLEHDAGVMKNQVLSHDLAETVQNHWIVDETQ